MSTQNGNTQAFPDTNSGDVVKVEDTWAAQIEKNQENDSRQKPWQTDFIIKTDDKFHGEDWVNIQDTKSCRGDSLAA